MMTHDNISSCSLILLYCMDIQRSTVSCTTCCHFDPTSFHGFCLYLTRLTYCGVSSLCCIQYNTVDVVRSSDIRVSERMPKTCLILQTREPVYNELLGDVCMTTTRLSTSCSLYVYLLSVRFLKKKPNGWTGICTLEKRSEMFIRRSCKQ